MGPAQRCFLAEAERSAAYAADVVAFHLQRVTLIKVPTTIQRSRGGGAAARSQSPPPEPRKPQPVRLSELQTSAGEGKQPGGVSQ